MKQNKFINLKYELKFVSKDLLHWISSLGTSYLLFFYQKNLNLEIDTSKLAPFLTRFEGSCIYVYLFTEKHAFFEFVLLRSGR